MSGDSKKHSRADISLRTRSFWFVSGYPQQGEGRRSQHGAIPASIPGQASILTAAGEERSLAWHQAFSRQAMGMGAHNA